MIMNRHVSSWICLTLLGVSSVAMAIQTPVGCPVSAIPAFPYDDDGTALALTMTLDLITTYQMNASIVSSAENLATYNCFGYAWHMTEGGEAAVISDDRPYYEDINGCAASYVHTTLGSGTKVGYYGAHAGIYIDAGARRVRSKWGTLGLVEHDEDDIALLYGAADCAYSYDDQHGPSEVVRFHVDSDSASWYVADVDGDVPARYAVQESRSWDDGPWNTVAKCDFRGPGVYEIALN